MRKKDKKTRSSDVCLHIFSGYITNTWNWLIATVCQWPIDQSAKERKHKERPGRVHDTFLEQSTNTSGGFTFIAFSRIANHVECSSNGKVTCTRYAWTEILHQCINPNSSECLLSQCYLNLRLKLIWIVEHVLTLFVTSNSCYCFLDTYCVLSLG